MRKFTISHRCTEITDMYWYISELGLDGRLQKVPQSPSRWRSICTELFLLLRRMERWGDTCNCTIFICGFVVKAMIAGVIVEIACREFLPYPQLSALNAWVLHVFTVGKERQHDCTRRSWRLLLGTFGWSRGCWTVSDSRGWCLRDGGFALGWP